MAKTNLLGGFLLALGVLAASAMAQPAPAPAPGGDNPGASRMEQMRTTMTAMLKDDLGATDEEMKAIGPQIEKVFTLQMDLRGSGMMRLFRKALAGGAGGPGGGGRFIMGGGNATPSAVQKALDDLLDTAEKKDAKPEDIKAKLDAYREARDKAKAELAKAQEDLKSLLTKKQEALLVGYGILD
jgi:hypothetical protein